MLNTSEKINNFLQFIGSFLDYPYDLIAVSGLIVFSILLLALLLIKIKNEKTIKETLYFENQLLRSVRAERNKEANINDLIGQFADQVIAHGYFFYTFDRKDKKFILTNTRINNESADIGPAYSGLLPYKKEKYEAPQSFEINEIPQNLGIISEGDVNLLCVPIAMEIGFICIGPLSRYFKLNKRKRHVMENSMESMRAVFSMMIENGDIKQQVQEMETKTQAIVSMKQSFTNYTEVIEAITQIALKTSEASGAFILKRDKTIGLSIPVIVGEDTEANENIRRELKSLKILEDIIGGDDYLQITKNELKYNQLPQVFSEMNIESLLLIDIGYKQFHGYMCIWFDVEKSLEAYRRTALVMMVKKIGEVLENYQVYNEISSSYINILKMISQMLDDISPKTVGRSEMMYRYAYVIADCLGLQEEDKQEIALASYLSNIGVVGLSGSIFLKSDKYSDTEFEMMKLHCEVGASIIESTIGNVNIARYILEHHERMDGLGYPARLKGEEISLGARILAVVQFFTAKLTGREGRPPVVFYEALDHVISASGSQLDSEIVDALVHWINEKGIGEKQRDKTLGPCWEMRCSPKSICLSCPVYGVLDKKCFDHGHNNCKAHGNECESCFVRTEFIGRVR